MIFNAHAPPVTKKGPQKPGSLAFWWASLNHVHGKLPLHPLPHALAASASPQHRATDAVCKEVIFTENTAPDREIWDEKGGLIKKGAAEIAERDQETDLSRGGEETGDACCDVGDVLGPNPETKSTGTSKTTHCSTDVLNLGQEPPMNVHFQTLELEVLFREGPLTSSQVLDLDIEGSSTLGTHQDHQGTPPEINAQQLMNPSACQDHVPEVKVLTTLGMFAVPVTAETTVGEIRQKVQEQRQHRSVR